jgi:hypothetical protein
VKSDFIRRQVYAVRHNATLRQQSASHKPPHTKDNRDRWRIHLISSHFRSMFARSAALRANWPTRRMSSIEEDPANLGVKMYLRRPSSAPSTSRTDVF